MTVERGRIVCSKAGRDRGSFLAVLEVNEKGVLLCDGKQRPLERPKLKTLKHIAPTTCTLKEEQLKTNKSLRHALNDYLVSQQSKER